MRGAGLSECFRRVIGLPPADEGCGYPRATPGPCPSNTTYTVADGGQIHVPEDAASCQGIQPVVHLLVDGRERTHVALGQPVTLTATIEVPAGKGSVVAENWDFEGTGDYAVEAALSATTSATVHFNATNVYHAPGTYYPALRATSQRQGDPDDEYAGIHNLGRAAVVVE